MEREPALLPGSAGAAGRAATLAAAESSRPVTKVLVISFVQPFPADDGKKAVLQGLVRYFLSRPCTQVEYLILNGAGPNESPSAQLAFHSLRARTPRLKPLLALARSIARRRPLQQTWLDSASLRRAIRRRLAKSRPDLVIYDTFRVSQLIDDPHAVLPNARHVLYLDDLFSVRYEAMLRAMERYPSIRVEPLGNFARHVPQPYRAVLNARRLCRYLLRREMRLVRRVETAAVARFDVSLLANEAEAALLRERSADDRIAALPIVLPHDDDPGPARRYMGAPEFVFIGSLNVAHNQCSLEYFIRHVFGGCVAQIPELRLRVIGQAPSDELRRLFAQHAGHIEWTPYIAELGDVFSRCAAMLVPLLFGSGVKMKTLEALLHALPVVSTPFGAEGIVSSPTEASGIIVENDVQQFPRHMRALLDPIENARMSRDARAYYAARFSAAACARRYQALFGV